MPSALQFQGPSLSGKLSIHELTNELGNPGLQVHNVLPSQILINLVLSNSRNSYPSISKENNDQPQNSML